MASLGRVLVVEDEPDVALVLHDALQEFGYQVRVAVDGHEAVQAVADFAPHVVLLDLWLPGLPGESVLDVLSRSAPKVPVVIVSGNRDEDRARATLSHGAFDYVAKPFELARARADGGRCQCRVRPANASRGKLTPGWGRWRGFGLDVWQHGG